MVQDSGWAFRSQQMAQQAGQWAVDRETESMRQQGQSIQQVGETIADMPDRYHRYVMQGVQRAAAPYDLQLKQRQVQLADEELRNAQQNITLNDLRRQKMVRELDLFNQMNSSEQLKLQTDLLRAQVEQTQAAAARYRQQAAFEQIGPGVQAAQAMEVLRTGMASDYDAKSGTFTKRPATPEEMQRNLMMLQLYRSSQRSGQGGMSADTALKGISDENAPAGVRKAYEQALETADPALAQTVKQTEERTKLAAKAEENFLAASNLVSPESIEGMNWKFLRPEEQKRVMAYAYQVLPDLKFQAEKLGGRKLSDSDIIKRFLERIASPGGSQDLRNLAAAGVINPNSEALMKAEESEQAMRNAWEQRFRR